MITAANNMHEAGIRKAAILVACLDEASADLLLDQLGPGCAARVCQAVMDLDELDPWERQRVIDEFRRIGPMVPDKSPSGIELDSPQAAQFVQMRAKHNSHSGRGGHDDSCVSGISIDKTKVSMPFDFLREAEEEKLSQLLAAERPQTIALVLSHLSPEQAGDVLPRFEAPLQAEVVRRLADLEKADPETLRQVEQSLQSRLTQQFAAPCQRTTGPEAVARILAACPSGVAEDILDNLADYDGALAEQLGRRPFTFDDLEAFDDASLLAVFRAAEPEVAQASLLGAPPPLVERILRRMIPDEAKRLRRKLDCPEPIRLSDIDQSRQQIAALAQRMSRGKTRKLPQAA